MGWAMGGGGGAYGETGVMGIFIARFSVAGLRLRIHFRPESWNFSNMNYILRPGSWNFSNENYIL